MKNLISFITFLVFLHCITNYMTSTEAKEADPVLDVYGNKLVEGDYYAPLSLFRPGAGVHYYPLPNCTYGVLQLVSGEGLSVTFRPANSEGEGTVIHESTDLNIKFTSSIGCAPSTVWKVSEHEEATPLVTTGGVAGNPGIENPNSWFQIRKAGDNYYKFVYCPRYPCLACIVICGDVGISYQYGLRRLAVGGEITLRVMFRREPGTNSNTRSTELAAVWLHRLSK